MITATSYPRAALIGNPSDGYYGKTIAFVFGNFKAEVTLEESPELKMTPGIHDRLSFFDINDLTHDIQQNGYYGGIRLLKGTIKKFKDYCGEQKIELPKRNFSISYSSNIPVRLGLAGSSAIVTAAMNAMLQFYKIDIPQPILANLILSVEKDELNIGAGLQDRVAQVYNSPVYMNFNKELMDKQGYGDYIPFDKKLLPPLYIAYRTHLSEGSEVTHNNLAERYAAKDTSVLDAIEQLKTLTDQCWANLQQGDQNIGVLLNKNFDIRKKLVTVSKGNLEMIEAVRVVGASAKFTGSGGAIIGTYDGNKMYDDLVSVMKKIDVAVIKPQVI